MSASPAAPVIDGEDIANYGNVSNSDKWWVGTYGIDVGMLTNKPPPARSLSRPMAVRSRPAWKGERFG